MSDLALLTEAARDAGALMMRRRGQVDVRRKTDGSPVTDADLAVNALLHERLTSARPTYGWLSEETLDDPARLKAQRVFIVDPIDGTSAYVEGAPWFAVSLAVVEDGRPIAGVIYAPALDELYAAETTKGAALNGAAIQPSATAALDGAVFLGNPSSRKSAQWKGVTVNRCNALALRMSRVASGESDAAISATPKNEWDLAAGVVICQEAGAVACDATGQALRFNTPAAKTPGLICCTPALLPLILAKTAAIAP